MGNEALNTAASETVTDWELMAKRVAAAAGCGEWHEVEEHENCWDCHDAYIELPDGIFLAEWNVGRKKHLSLTDSLEFADEVEFFDVTIMGNHAVPLREQEMCPRLGHQMALILTLARIDAEEVCVISFTELLTEHLYPYIARCNAMGITHGWEDQC